MAELGFLYKKNVCNWGRLYMCNNSCKNITYSNYIRSSARELQSKNTIICDMRDESMCYFLFCLLWIYETVYVCIYVMIRQ